MRFGQILDTSGKSAAFLHHRTIRQTHTWPRNGGDSRKCQTNTASPAEPGGLPTILGRLEPFARPTGKWREGQRHRHRTQTDAQGADIEPTIVVESVEYHAAGPGPKAMPRLDTIVAAPN